MAKNIAIVSLLLGATSLEAKEVVYSYRNSDEGLAFVGTLKAELYDVAITISDPVLKGSKITGIEVPVNAIPDITELSAWITTELKLEEDPTTGRKVNAPNVCSVEATLNDGVIRASFPTPYIIGDGPVYVGYSFLIPEVTREENDPAKYPVAVAAGYEPGALMMHTRRHFLQWGDRGESLGGKSAMKVFIDGDFQSVSASIKGVKDVQSQGNVTTVDFPLEVRSYGSEPISSLKFSYTYQGKTSTQVMNYDTPIVPVFGQPFLITVSVPNEFTTGTETFHVTLEEINGQSNPNPSKETTFSLSILRLLPKKRPVVEEYTGLWCGWCPRGYVGMETMAEEEPEFIGIAIHSSDPMCILELDEYPSESAGFPSCYIDRSGSAKSPSASSLRKYWNEFSELYTPLEISVSAVRGTTDPENIYVTSNFSFVEAPENPCRVSYMLLANGLKDDNWAQENYFSTRYEEGMDSFYGQPKKIYGLVFNDVLAMHSPFNGEEGSVPAPTDIVPYENMQHEYVFHTAGAVSLEGYDLIRAAGDNLAVVAVITDSVTGEIINGAKYNLGTSGVETVDNEMREIKRIIFYNMSGVQVNKPADGLFVKVTEFTDGTLSTEKVILK